MVGQKHFIFMDAKDTAVLSMNELYSLIANTEFPGIGERYTRLQKNIKSSIFWIPIMLLRVAHFDLRKYTPSPEQEEVYRTIADNLNLYIAKFDASLRHRERFLKATQDHDPFLLCTVLHGFENTMALNVYLLSTISTEAAVALLMHDYLAVRRFLKSKKEDIEKSVDYYEKIVIFYILRSMYNPFDQNVRPLLTVFSLDVEKEIEGINEDRNADSDPYEEELREEEKKEEAKEPGGVVVVKDEEYEDSADEDIICHETSPQNRGNQESGARKLKLPDEVYERKNGAWNRKAYDKARQPLAYARKLLRGINPYDEVSEALKVLKSPPAPEVAIEILRNLAPTVQHERDSKHIQTAIEYLKKFQEVTAQ